MAHGLSVRAGKFNDEIRKSKRKFVETFENQLNEEYNLEPLRQKKQNIKNYEPVKELPKLIKKEAEVEIIQLIIEKRKREEDEETTQPNQKRHAIEESDKIQTNVQNTNATNLLNINEDGSVYLKIYEILNSNKNKLQKDEFIKNLQEETIKSNNPIKKTLSILKNYFLPIFGREFYNQQVDSDKIIIMTKENNFNNIIEENKLTLTFEEFTNIVTFMYIKILIDVCNLYDYVIENSDFPNGFNIIVNFITSIIRWHSYFYKEVYLLNDQQDILKAINNINYITDSLKVNIYDTIKWKELEVFIIGNNNENTGNTLFTFNILKSNFYAAKVFGIQTSFASAEHSITIENLEKKVESYKTGIIPPNSVPENEKKAVQYSMEIEKLSNELKFYKNDVKSNENYEKNISIINESLEKIFKEAEELVENKQTEVQLNESIRNLSPNNQIISSTNIDQTNEIEEYFQSYNKKIIHYSIPSENDEQRIKSLQEEINNFKLRMMNFYDKLLIEIKLKNQKIENSEAIFKLKIKILENEKATKDITIQDLINEKDEKLKKIEDQLVVFNNSKQNSFNLLTDSRTPINNKEIQPFNAKLDSIATTQEENFKKFMTTLQEYFAKINSTPQQSTIAQGQIDLTPINTELDLIVRNHNTQLVESINSKIKNELITVVNSSLGIVSDQQIKIIELLTILSRILSGGSNMLSPISTIQGPAPSMDLALNYNIGKIEKDMETLTKNINQISNLSTKNDVNQANEDLKKKIIEYIDSTNRKLNTELSLILPAINDINHFQKGLENNYLQMIKNNTSQLQIINDKNQGELVIYNQKLNSLESGILALTGTMPLQTINASLARIEESCKNRISSSLIESFNSNIGKLQLIADSKQISSKMFQTAPVDSALQGIIASYKETLSKLSDTVPKSIQDIKELITNEGHAITTLTDIAKEIKDSTGKNTDIIKDIQLKVQKPEDNSIARLIEIITRIDTNIIPITGSIDSSKNAIITKIDTLKNETLAENNKLREEKTAEATKCTEEKNKCKNEKLELGYQSKLKEQAATAAAATATTTTATGTTSTGTLTIPNENILTEIVIKALEKDRQQQLLQNLEQRQMAILEDVAPELVQKYQLAQQMNEQKAQPMEVVQSTDKPTYEPIHRKPIYQDTEMPVYNAIPRDPLYIPIHRGIDTEMTRQLKARLFQLEQLNKELKGTSKQNTLKAQIKGIRTNLIKDKHSHKEEKGCETTMRSTVCDIAKNKVKGHRYRDSDLSSEMALSMTVFQNTPNLSLSELSTKDGSLMAIQKAIVYGIVNNSMPYFIKMQNMISTELARIFEETSKSLDRQIKVFKGLERLDVGKDHSSLKKIREALNKQDPRTNGEAMKELDNYETKLAAEESVKLVKKTRDDERYQITNEQFKEIKSLLGTNQKELTEVKTMVFGMR